MAESSLKSKKSYQPLYVIAGRDDSLVNTEADKLLDQLLEPHEKATGLFNADPDQVSASAVLDELRTLPFLTKKRVVLLRGAEDFISKNRDLLEKYFDNPCPTGILVLTVSSWDARTKLAKKLPGLGQLINITPPKPSMLPDRLVGYARDAHDKKLTTEAARLLIDLAGDDLGRLYGEIDKLALFANDEKVITPAHIESLIGHNRLFNAFAVIDAILTGNIAQSVDRLRSMFAEDKSAEFTAVGAFAFHFRRLFNAKVLLQKGCSESDIIGKLRIWGNKEGFFAQLKKMSLRRIGDTLQKLAEIDYEIKTGQTKAPVAIELLVLSLHT